MDRKNALVAGATGLIGKYLLEELSASAYYQKVYALVRRPGSVFGAEEIVSDFDTLSVASFPEGITDVFCSLGTTISKAGSRENFKKVDYEYVLKLAEFAKEKGAKSFLVVSALGADPKSLVFYNRVKGEMERGLEEIGFSFLGIFRPSLLEGERKEVRPGETVGQFFCKDRKSVLVRWNSKIQIDSRKNRSESHDSYRTKRTERGSYFRIGPNCGPILILFLPHSYLKFTAHRDQELPRRTGNRIWNGGYKIFLIRYVVTIDLKMIMIVLIINGRVVQSVRRKKKRIRVIRGYGVYITSAQSESKAR